MLALAKDETKQSIRNDICYNNKWNGMHEIKKMNKFLN